MVNIVAIIVLYCIFGMNSGCAAKVLMQNCSHLNGVYYACEKAGP